MVERIHFFRHDVGGGTQGTVKQGPVVKGRGFDFRDAMLFYRGLKKSFQVPPFAVGGVEGVVGAAWGVEGGGWVFFGGEESTKEGVKGALEPIIVWPRHVVGVVIYTSVSLSVGTYLVLHFNGSVYKPRTFTP